MPGSAEFPAVFTPAGIQVLQQRPEPGRVIHVACMAQLMQHDVAHKVGGYEDQTRIEANRAAP